LARFIFNGDRKTRIGKIWLIGKKDEARIDAGFGDYALGNDLTWLKSDSVFSVFNWDIGFWGGAKG